VEGGVQCDGSDLVARVQRHVDHITQRNGRRRCRGRTHSSDAREVGERDVDVEDSSWRSTNGEELIGTVRARSLPHAKVRVRFGGEHHRSVQGGARRHVGADESFALECLLSRTAYHAVESDRRPGSRPDDNLLQLVGRCPEGHRSVRDRDYAPAD